MYAARTKIFAKYHAHKSPSRHNARGIRLYLPIKKEISILPCFSHAKRRKILLIYEAEAGEKKERRKLIVFLAMVAINQRVRRSVKLKYCSVNIKLY